MYVGVSISQCFIQKVGSLGFPTTKLKFPRCWPPPYTCITFPPKDLATSIMSITLQSPNHDILYMYETLQV